ncbi:NrfD/PsrC family molybdoenzyme membrane anchor subunit, partial [Micromonospora sp. NPDC003776]
MSPERAPVGHLFRRFRERLAAEGPERLGGTGGHAGHGPKVTPPPGTAPEGGPGTPGVNGSAG